MSFKRRFYYDIEEILDSNKTRSVFLSGPLKSGKSTCLRQLKERFPESEYRNIKTDFATDRERLKFLSSIISSIKNNEKKIFLLDDISYFVYPDKTVCEIEETLAMNPQSPAKFVFTGNPPRAIEYWGHIASGGFAAFINTSFLTYTEWLKSSGKTEDLEESCMDFIRNSRNFYSDFFNTKEYLQACLDETAVSNSKAAEIIFLNDIEGLSTDMLMTVLYASLYKSLRDFSEKPDGQTMSFLKENFENFGKMKASDMKQSLMFLYNCGIVSVSKAPDSSKSDPFLQNKLLKSETSYFSQEEIMNDFIVEINLPMFYEELLRGGGKEEIPIKILKNFLKKSKI